MSPQEANSLSLPKAEPIAGLPLARDAEQDTALAMAAMLLGFSVARDRRRAAARAGLS